MSSTIIRISSADLAEVKELFLIRHRKIQAIKYARDKGLSFVPGGDVKGVRPSLRDAKVAVEALKEGTPNRDVEFSTFPRVCGVILDTGEGRAMVDLDELQLRLLGELQTLPLEVLAPSLEMLQYLRNWATENYATEA